MTQSWTKETATIIEQNAYDMSGVLSIIEDRKMLFNECVKAVHEKTGIPKKVISKYFRAYHKGTLDDLMAEDAEFVDLVEMLSGSDTKDTTAPMGLKVV